MVATEYTAKPSLSDNITDESTTTSLQDTDQKIPLQGEDLCLDYTWDLFINPKSLALSFPISLQFMVWL